MFNQLYYSTRNRLTLRLIALAVVVFGNIIFFVVPGNVAFNTLAIVFASFAYMGISAINLFASFTNLNGIFKAPNSYVMALTPVHPWKRLFGSVVPAVFFDTLGFFVGIGGILIQTTGTGIDFEDMMGTMGSSIPLSHYFIFMLVAGLALYGLFLIGFLFWRAVSRSILYRYPFRNLLGFVIAVAAMMAVSWFNVLLLPFGELINFGPFFNIQISQYTGFHFALMVLSILLQGAVLLWAAAQLMNRRINI